MDKIAILDYGSQYTHLIATRIRRLGVYSEILDPEATPEKLREFKGLILSGGPASVYEKEAPSATPKIFNLDIPILGICYGHQLIAQLLGGRVEPGKGQGAEFGKAEIQVNLVGGLFKGFKVGELCTVWMSHGDRVTRLPDDFRILASSKEDPYSAVGDPSCHIYGLQFHPEVKHTEKGQEILSNFLDLTKAKRDWDLGSYIDFALKNIKKQVGRRNVFMLVSGGVDSTVAHALLSKALGQDRVYGLFVDTGFLRAGEREQVESALKKIGIKNLHVLDSGKQFLKALAGVTEPEQKRQIIGRLFVEIQHHVAQKLKLDPKKWMLGQGTIYPDTIESGGTRHAAKIKTHHNRVPEIEALIKSGRVIEPLKDLYKNEVREVGEKLGLPAELIWRHPFPGPGLAVRILCAKKEDFAPAHKKLEKEIQAFLRQKKSHLKALTLPIKSVGVQGDMRTYRHPLVLIGPSTWQELSALAPELTNRFRAINRVLYLISPTQIKSLSLTPAALTPARISRLQKADRLAMTWLQKIGASREVWQMPTVLLPVSVSAKVSGTANASAGPKAKESIVLRPVNSEEAMTAHFSSLPMEKVRALAAQILRDPTLSAVFYDITNKPPGTIEWE